MSAAGFIEHPLLGGCGVAHGFGTRGGEPPVGLLRPQQVHGAEVAEVRATRALSREQADAVVSTRPGVSIGVVTADCVPLLASARDGCVVAAIHAGWRGLAAGVVERGIERLRGLAGSGSGLVAVVGPSIGRCCYEVDAPVLTALERRFGAGLQQALSPSRPGHQRLDLAVLARAELLRAGLPEGCIGVLEDACTCCDAGRFHSYRRSGERAGRLVHYITACRGTCGEP